jgi:hypothetical protein
MLRRIKIGLAFLSLTSAGAVACAGSADPPANGGSGAISEAPKKAAASTSAPGSNEPAPPNGGASSLQVTGDSFKIAEAVLVHDQSLNEDQTQTPTARIIFSSHAGTCNRLDSGFTMAPDEKAFSVRVKQPAFSQGKVTFTTDATTSACVYIDGDLLCGGNGGTAKGTGTLDVATVSASQLTGSVDITVGSRRLQGTFTATACPDGKITNNIVTCGIVQGDSTEQSEPGDGEAGPSSPAPASSGNR